MSGCFIIQLADMVHYYCCLFIRLAFTLLFRIILYYILFINMFGLTNKCCMFVVSKVWNMTRTKDISKLKNLAL